MKRKKEELRRPLIDRLALDYVITQVLLEGLRSRLIAQVKKRGVRPPRSDKTKRLTGLEFEVTLSGGSTTVIDHEYLRGFGINKLESGPEARLFHKVFVAVPRYELADDAERILRCAVDGERLRRVYRRAVQVKPRAAQLTVKKIGQAKRRAGRPYKGKRE